MQGFQLCHNTRTVFPVSYPKPACCSFQNTACPVFGLNGVIDQGRQVVFTYQIVLVFLKELCHQAFGFGVDIRKETPAVHGTKCVGSKLQVFLCAVLMGGSAQNAAVAFFADPQAFYNIPLDTGPDGDSVFSSR